MLFQTHSAEGGLESSRVAGVGFAEPDWCGDADFGADVDPADLDRLIDDMAMQIEGGAQCGWLDAYYARRASFDLQSIRCQITHERYRHGPVLAGESLAAILSRIDRLMRFLKAAEALEA